MKFALLLVILVLLLHTLLLSQLVCADKFRYYAPNHSLVWFGSTKNMKWTENKEYCEARQGTMLIIKDENFQTWVRNNVYDGFSFLGGFTCSGCQGKRWYWVDGTMLSSRFGNYYCSHSYCNWETGPESASQYRYLNFYHYTGLWYDNVHSGAMYYPICMFRRVVPAFSSTLNGVAYTPNIAPANSSHQSSCSQQFPGARNVSSISSSYQQGIQTDVRSLYYNTLALLCEVKLPSITPQQTSYLATSSVSSGIYVQGTNGNTFYDADVKRFRQRNAYYTSSIFTSQLNYDEPTHGTPQFVSVLVPNKWWLILTTSGVVLKVDVTSSTVTSLQGGFVFHRAPSCYLEHQLCVVYAETDTVVYGIDGQNDDVLGAYTFGEKLWYVHLLEEEPLRFVIARSTYLRTIRFARHPTLYTIVLVGNKNVGLSTRIPVRRWGKFSNRLGENNTILVDFLGGYSSVPVAYYDSLNTAEFCKPACEAIGYSSVTSCSVSKLNVSAAVHVNVSSTFTVFPEKVFTKELAALTCNGQQSSSKTQSSSAYSGNFIYKSLTTALALYDLNSTAGQLLSNTSSNLVFRNLSMWTIDTSKSLIGVAAVIEGGSCSSSVYSFCNSTACTFTETFLGFESSLKGDIVSSKSCLITVTATIDANDDTGNNTIISATSFRGLFPWTPPQDANVSSQTRVAFPSVSFLSHDSSSMNDYDAGTRWLDMSDSTLHFINYTTPKYSSSSSSEVTSFVTIQDDAVRVMRRIEEQNVGGAVGLVKFAVLVESEDYGEKLSVLRCGIPVSGRISFANSSSLWFSDTAGVLERVSSPPSISSSSYQPDLGNDASFDKVVATFGIIPPSSCNANATRIELRISITGAATTLNVPFVLLPVGATVPDEYPSTFYGGGGVSTTTTASTTTIASTSSTTEIPTTTTSTTISGTTTITSTTTTTTIQPTCPPGTYGLSTEGSVSCEQCPQGHYCSDSNQTSPTPCAAGSASSETSATSSSVCQICPAGSAASSGSIQCQLCLQGSYSSSSNSSQCILAPLGKFVSGVGATSAISCPAGTSTSELGAKDEADCVACTSGTYSTAGRACMNCSKGSYCSTSACSVCTSCSVGYFAQKEASRTCLPCPKETFASSPASVNCSGCGNGYTTNGLTAQSLCTPIPPTTTLPYLTQIPPVITYDPLPPSLNEFIASTTQTTTSSAPLSPGQTLPPAPFVDEISSKNSLDGIGTALKFLSINPDSEGNPVATPPFTVTMSLADVSLGSFVVRSWLTSSQVVISSSNPPSFTVTITSNNATALSEALKTAVLFNVAPRAKALNLTQSAKFLRVAVSDASSSSSSSNNAYASLMLDTLVENIGPVPTRLNNKNESERIIVNVSRGLKFDTSVGVIAVHPQDLPLQVAVQQYDGSPLPSTMRCNCRVITIMQKRYVNCSAIGTLSQEYPLFTEVLVSDGYVLKKISLVFVTQSIPLQISSLIVPPVYLRPGKTFEYQVPSGLFISSTEISYIKMNRAGGLPLPSSMNFVPNILRGTFSTPGDLLLEVLAEDLFTKLVRNITFVFTNNDVKCVKVVQRSSFNNENTTTGTTSSPPPPSITTTTTTVNNTNNMTSSSNTNSNYTLNTDGTASATSIIKPVVALREFERVVDLSSLCHDADAEDSLVYSVRSLPGASWSRAEIRQSTLTLSGSPPRTAGFVGQTFDILVEVTDTFQKIATELKLFLTVIKNTAPQLIKPLPELPVTPSESKTFVVLINEYYVDAQGDDMFVSASIAVGQTAPWLKISSSLNAQPATVTIEAEPEDNGEAVEETIEVVVNVRDSLGNSSEPRTLKVKVVLTSWQKARYYVMVAASALASILGVVSMFWIIPYFFNICNRKNVVIPCPLSYDTQTFNFPDDTRECLFQIRAKHWYHKVLVCMPAFVRDDLSLDPTSDGSPPSWLKVEDHQVKLEIPNDASYEPRVPVITFRFFTRFGVLLCQFDVDYHEVTAGWIYGLDALLNDENATLSPEHLKQTSTHIISHQDSQQAQLRSDVKKEIASTRNDIASTKNEIYSAKSQVQRVESEVLSMRELLERALDGGNFSPRSSTSATAAASSSSSRRRNSASLQKPLIDDDIELDEFDLGISSSNNKEDDDLDLLMGKPLQDQEEQEDEAFGKANFQGKEGRYRVKEYDTELEILLDAPATINKKQKKQQEQVPDQNPILNRLRGGTYVKTENNNTAEDDEIEKYLSSTVEDSKTKQFSKSSSSSVAKKKNK